ncbi:MAG TPA: hypothetical protein VMF65_25195, partial [Acidimicrobiales bacterium]|nr:hypothetical protein [Acidimicrobiales bacterium]
PRRPGCYRVVPAPRRPGCYRVVPAPRRPGCYRVVPAPPDRLLPGTAGPVPAGGVDILLMTVDNKGGVG